MQTPQSHIFLLPAMPKSIPSVPNPGFRVSPRSRSLGPAGKDAKAISLPIPAYPFISGSHLDLHGIPGTADDFHDKFREILSAHLLGERLSIALEIHIHFGRIFRQNSARGSPRLPGLVPAATLKLGRSSDPRTVPSPSTEPGSWPRLASGNS